MSGSQEKGPGTTRPRDKESQAYLLYHFFFLGFVLLEDEATLPSSVVAMDPKLLERASESLMSPAGSRF